jgi:hypothetical protein
LIEAFNYVMSEIIAYMFDIFDLIRILDAIIEIIEQFLLQLCARIKLQRDAIEKIEVLLFPRQQAKHI